MNHLDEGTIHAWLDGAVDATQSRDIEAHIATCDACSAAVAEARGLVAASSRILSALDDVPAGVIPKKALPPTRQAPVRQWRAARWVTGIAAALMLAVGVTTWNREAVQSEMTSMSPAGALTSSTPPAAEAQAPVVVPAPVVGAAAGSAVEAQRGKRAPVVANVPASPAPAPPVEPQRKSAESEQTLAARQLRDEQQSRRAAEPTVADAATDSRTDAEKRDLSRSAAAPRPSAMRAPTLRLETVVTTGAGAGASAEESRRRANDDSTRLRGTYAAASADLATVAGCYRLPQREETLLQRAAGVASAVGKAARASSGVPAPAAAPAPAADLAARAPALLRLDTLPHPLGFRAASTASDSTVGWWRMLGRDSVTVDLLSAGVFRFAATDRVKCPE